MSISDKCFVDGMGNPLILTLELFNALRGGNGQIVVSAPDIYEAGKTGSEEVMMSLRNDFEHGIITSTRFVYEERTGNSEITHYYKSPRIEQKTQNLFLPDYFKGVINITSQSFQTEEGLKFLQTLFNTTDDIEKIRLTLEKLSNNKNIILDTTILGGIGRNKVKGTLGFLNDQQGYFAVKIFPNYHPSISRSVKDNLAGIINKERSNKEVALDKILEKEFLLDGLEQGINRKTGCVHFVNSQNIGNIIKYSGVFCFDKNRYVLSMTIPKTDVDDFKDKLGKILGKDISSEEKIKKISEDFKPIYSHLLRYQKKNKKYSLVDDIEAFGKPRTK